MIRIYFSAVFLSLNLAAMPLTPIQMASDLNLTNNQLRELQRIDASVEQVKRHSQAKQIEVLTPEQRVRFITRQKSLCNTN